MLRQIGAQNKAARNLRQTARATCAKVLRLPVKHTYLLNMPAQPDSLSRTRAAAASVAVESQIIPPDRPDEAVLRYARELAKRLAREDHYVQIAARPASNPAIAKSP